MTVSRKTKSMQMKRMAQTKKSKKERLEQQDNNTGIKEAHSLTNKTHLTRRFKMTQY